MHTSGRRISHPLFAAVYDSLTGAYERKVLGGWREELLAGCRGRVLDAGAGTGANFPALKRFAEEGAVTFIDAVEPDPHMLRRARARARRLDLDVQFHQAPAEALPFPDAVFDHVLCTLVLCSVGDPAASIREFRRVLRPGGSLHFIEHVRADGAKGRWQDRLAPAWALMAGGCRLNRCTGDLLRDEFEAAALELRRAPFPVCNVLIGRAVKPADGMEADPRP